MKYILLVLLLISSTALAKDIPLQWDASPSQVTGYKIYISASADMSSPTVVDVGNVLQTTITGLSDDTGHYLAATAYNLVGKESGFSNVVFSEGFGIPAPPGSLTGLSIINNTEIPLQ